MDLRPLSPDYAVSPQVEPGDFAAIAAAGYRTVINNRPAEEVPDDLSPVAMRAAAEAAGLAYEENPVRNGGLTLDMVERQAAVLAASDGPVLAWCRSGTRSSIVWALGQAGKRPTEEILADLEQAGYQVPGLGQQIDALAQA